MSSRIVRIATAVALATGLAVTASACSSSSTASNAPSNAPSTSQNQINPQPVSKLQQGGYLNFPVDQYSSQWNLLNASANNEMSINWTMGPLLPQLFKEAADGSLSPNPDYLANVTNKVVNGKQVTTYDINPKAKWSDGTPLTWQDFKDNWYAQSGQNSKYTPLGTTGYQQMESVTQGKNAQEAVVSYKTPFADWKTMFFPFYPGSQIDTPDKFNNAYNGKIPVTAGPYVLKSMNPTTKVVTVVRNPHWWGAQKPVLDGINFRTVDAASEPGAFASGEIDWEDIGPDVNMFKQAKQVQGASIRVAGAPNNRTLYLNGQSPMLSDVNVRQAVVYAIDRQAVEKSDLNGLPWPTKLLNNHFLVNNQPQYQDNSGGLGSFDPAKAKQLLDQAGWKQNGQYRSKGGKQLTLNLDIPSGTPTATNEASAFSAMLGAVGIKVNTVASASDAFFNDVSSGKFDLTVFSNIGSIPFAPLPNTQATLQSPVGGNVGQNYSRIGSAEADAAMNAAGTATSPSAYYADLNKADAAIWKAAYNLPLYQRPNLVATKSNLANFGAFGFQSYDWTTIGFTK